MAESIVGSPTLSAQADPPLRRASLFVLAHDEPTFHLFAEPATPGATGRSLCGAVVAWPDGGRYRTGRPKPRVADSTNGRRHLCDRCRDAYEAEQYAAQMDRLVDRLLRTARHLSDQRLAYATQVAPTSVARQVARQVLHERGLRPTPTLDGAMSALLAQQTADLAEMAVAS